MKYPAPIALFVYQRLQQTERTVGALAQNELAAESDLYIYSDAAKNIAAQDNVAAVRSFIKTIHGFKSINIIERSTNYGLSNSIIEGVSTLVEQFGRTIVLEDDLETSRYFLRFMNNGLNFYESDDRVVSIHGYVYPVKRDLPDNYFLRGADCWGWATWKRGWNLFQSDGKALLQNIEERKLQYQFDFNGTYPYTQMLKDQIKGVNDSWAVRWYASAFLENKLTLYPGISLVNNISDESVGTHTKSFKSLRKHRLQPALTEIPVVTIPVEDNVVARKAFEEFFRNLRIPFISKVLMFFRSLK